MEPCQVTVHEPRPMTHLRCDDLTKSFRHKKVVNNVALEVREEKSSVARSQWRRKDHDLLYDGGPFFSPAGGGLF